MKRNSIFSSTLLVSSAIVAGCGHAPAQAPLRASSPAVEAALRAGTLRVRANLAAYKTQDLAGGGYTAADVSTVTLTVSDESGNVLATSTLNQSDLSDTITFSNLPIEVVKVLAQAANADGELISVDTDSTTTVDVTADGSNVVSLLVQLADKTQPTINVSFSGIDVLPGDLISPGAVTISTSSASPTSSTGTGSVSTSTSGSTSTSTSSTSSPSTSVSTWDDAATYQFGQEVVYNGFVWEAEDLIQPGNAPGSWPMWTEIGPASASASTTGSTSASSTTGSAT